ncbi:MAG: PilZ domain-containing protein [Acidobacteriaceae bacterium]
MFFPPVKDQRRSERQWIALPVHIYMGKSLIEGTTLNLSEHGMYLFTAANIPFDAKIEVVFRPPSEKETVRASAMVRRKVVYLYGIEFLNKRAQRAEEQSLLQSPGETLGEPLNSSSL